MIDINYHLADCDDKKRIIEFLDLNWGEKHPLVHIEDFFNYYYCTNNNFINFAIAEDKNTKEIQAICGFIPCNKNSTDIWVSIWCSNKNKGSMGVGLELMSKMQELTNANNISCNNIRPETIPFYNFLGYTAKRIPHYYLLNNNMEYKIAKIENKTLIKSIINKKISLIPITSINEIDNFNINEFKKPQKDLWHIKRRYFNFPYKKYQLFFCVENNKKIAILVIEHIKVNDSSVLRIVDFIGDENIFAQLNLALNSLLNTYNSEYIDCYMYGYSNDTFNKCGFIERVEGDVNIIPNYLEPPLYKNIEYYFFTNNTDNFTMWKADGDQNRPNIKSTRCSPPL